DVAAEADIARSVAAVLVTVLPAIAAAGAHQPGNTQPIRAALDVGDRGDPYCAGTVVAAVALAVALAVAAVVAAAVPRGCLCHGGGGALRDRLTVGHIVAIAKQLIDDLADGVLTIPLIVAIALLAIAGIRLLR